MLPTLEDANSIQLGLAGVIRQLVNREINPKMAALLLYALQTASANLKYTSFEPEPTRVVIDRECVARRPIGATAWSTVEGREYDEIEKDDVEKDDLDKEVEKECRSKEGQEFMANSVASRKKNPPGTERSRQQNGRTQEVLSHDRHGRTEHGGSETHRR